MLAPGTGKRRTKIIYSGFPSREGRGCKTSHPACFLHRSRSRSPRRVSSSEKTPYTPEQKGMIERFFLSLKEECVWQYNFDSFERASQKIREWIRWYNQQRPHQALGYQSPLQFRKKSTAGGLISGEGCIDLSPGAVLTLTHISSTHPHSPTRDDRL
jgi:transposase InsO family protein